MEFIIGRLRATFLYFIALFIRKSSHPTILCMNWHDSCRLCCMKFREECHMVIQLAHCSTCSGRYQCTVHTTIFVLIICLQIHLTHKRLLKLYFAHARDHTARVYSTRQCVSLHQFAEQQKLSVTFHSSAVFVWRIDIGRTAPPQSVTWAAHIHYTCRCRNAYYASDTQHTAHTHDCSSTWQQFENIVKSIAGGTSNWYSMKNNSHIRWVHSKDNFQNGNFD